MRHRQRTGRLTRSSTKADLRETNDQRAVGPMTHARDSVMSRRAGFGGVLKREFRMSGKIKPNDGNSVMESRVVNESSKS